ncbi:VWA domain-containing protein [Devosia algicola]|uniref:VWA domain-containing protein n=1 Tax=Devosia algicola TaxID=3026418 RepID=A0ABY7YJC4_9HYPH|nr:VWA domain-containing protein [Devosia algicola]WDR01292.1 VWA domain-containing protein [Devosia algicola]
MPRRPDVANGIVSIRLERVCLDPDGDESRLIVEGRLTNPHQTDSLDVLPAARLFQVRGEGVILAADAALDDILISEFAQPLGPLASREFVVAFPLTETRPDLDFVHPAQAGILSFPVVRDGVLITGKTLPPVQVPVADAPEETEAPQADATMPVPSVPINEPVSAAPEISTATGCVAMGDSCVERLDGVYDASEIVISRADFGGTITRLDHPSQDVDEIFLRYEDASFIDGDTYHTHRVHADTPDQPVSFAMTFAGGATAKIAAVRVHGYPTKEFSYHQQKMAVYVSMDGVAGPWTMVGLPVAGNKNATIEELRLAVPVAASAVRIDMFPHPDSNYYRSAYNVTLSEIEVVEAEEAATDASVLSPVKVNALDMTFDGHAVAFTSQLDETTNSISATLNQQEETFWQPATNLLPQELTYAFHGHDVQHIDELTLTMTGQTAFPTDWAPNIRVEVSADVSPLSPYEGLGAMRADPATGQLSLNLSNAVAARYVRFIIVDPGVLPFGVSKVTARGRLLDFVRADNVSTREGRQTASVDDDEREPTNDTMAGATLLPLGVAITGRPNSETDVDFYRFVVSGPETSAVTVRLAGLPRVKVNLTLLSAEGVQIATTPAGGAATERLFTWVLAPGEYILELAQHPATVAMFVDNSGSMGSAIYDALDAADTYVETKMADEMLSLFSFSSLPERLVERTSDSQALFSAIKTWRAASDAGAQNGTSLYDSLMAGRDELKDAEGNKAIILLTDGADATSDRSLERFWSEISSLDVPVFSIGYGGSMADFAEAEGARGRDVMRSISLATEGAFYEAPTSAELGGVFAAIADRIRGLNGYRISYDVSPGTGTLEVLEVGGEMVAAGSVGTTMVIFDASGSMKARTDAGRGRINVARTVLFDLLEQVPKTVPMGLWLYGHSRPSEPKDLSCRDVSLMVPPTPMNRDTIKEVAKGITPQGQTPIGYALHLAGESFAEGQKGLVILLTDGEETCDAEADAPYNPEAIVQQLIDRGVDLRVNIVGFDVSDPTVQAELASVAGLTGGNFYYGEGQDGLREAMTSAFAAPIDVLDDTDRVIASGLVGGGPITLPQGRYRIRVAGTDFLSERQSVTQDRATRLYLRQEASAVRLRVEETSIGASYSPDNGETAQQDDVRVAFDPTTRVPEMPEELVFKTQSLLVDLGYDPGPLDGAMGGKTRQAAQAFLDKNGPIMAGTPFDARGNPTLMLWIELLAASLEARRAD